MLLVHIAPLLLGTGIALGLGAPLARAAAGHGVSAAAFTFWPTLAAGLVLGLLGWLRHGPPAGVPRLLRFGAIAGLLGHALPMSALFWLSGHAGAAFASLSLALPPVFTLAIVLAAGLERPAARRVVAVALGLAGAVLMLASRGGSFEATGAALAAAFFIPATIGAANVYRSRHMPPGMSGEWLAAATLLASCAALALAGAAGGAVVPPVPPGGWPWLAANAVALVVGYLLYFALQRRADAVTFSFIGYVMMLAGVVLGTAVFGERLSWTVLPAAGLVLAALLLLRSTPPTPPATAARDACGASA